MIEQKRSSMLFSERTDSDLLQQRVRRQRQRRTHNAQPLRTVGQSIAQLLSAPSPSLRKVPTRFLLHAVIVLVLPLAAMLSTMRLQPQAAPAADQPLPNSADLPLGLGPLNLDTTVEDQGQPVVGDAPLSDQDAIPVPLSLTSRTEALAPLIVQAQVTGDTAKVRNGPGLEYDEVTKLAAGTPVQVIGRYGEWLQVRQADTTPAYWVANELIDIPDTSVFTLFEVPADKIPAPPPAKVATAREANLNLRDGPGTNYAGIIKIDAGAQMSLIEQYQDWIHVALADNRDGWVKTEFLAMVDGVMSRVPVANAIPDPNPAMVGTINDSGVSLRKGPGSSYAKVGSAGTGAQVSLLAQYKDWFKIQTGNGTTAWIFSDLLNVPAMALRRVPTTNDIPALPVAQPAQVARATTSKSPSTSTSSRPAAAVAPSSNDNAARAVRASGDVAGYAVQFVGNRYRYGGASPAGFDCSGLTSYVYAKMGVRLPHSAAGQYSSAYGARIGDMGNLAPGDLVFFAGTAGHHGISHVAMYIGGGRIVHAMTPRLGVQVSNVFESYWTSHYVGAIRPYRP